MAKKTKYQSTHNPVSKVEIKCDGKSINGRCEKCGRDLLKNAKHNPNQTGSLGWISRYADGSVFIDSKKA